MKNMLLILSVCLFSCKTANKDKNAELLIGKWELEQTTINGTTISRNNMKAGIEENFRIDKQNWINKNHSFTERDSLALLEKSRQSVHALMQMQYDIQKNKRVTLTIPSILSQSGTYLYKSNKLFIDFSSSGKNNKREFKVWLHQDTLHLFPSDDGGEFIFTRVR